MPPGFDPKPGSVNPKQPSFSPVASAGSYRCTVSWNVGRLHVSNKVTIKVKKAWRKKKVTVRASCRSVSHLNFTRTRSVRIR